DLLSISSPGNVNDEVTECPISGATPESVSCGASQHRAVKTEFFAMRWGVEDPLVDPPHQRFAREVRRQSKEDGKVSPQTMHNEHRRTRGARDRILRNSPVG